MCKLGRPVHAGPHADHADHAGPHADHAGPRGTTAERRSQFIGLILAASSLYFMRSHLEELDDGHTQSTPRVGEVLNGHGDDVH